MPSPSFTCTCAGGAKSLAPGAGTPPHQHDCDEVVICLGGEGELRTDGRQQRLGSQSILILPRGRVHQFLNVGSQPPGNTGNFRPVTCAHKTARWPASAVAMAQLRRVRIACTH
ncbi:cupin domain-containing protein [Paraburkholderia caffeinitolerans]